MADSSLNAISPVDGRYFSKTKPLQKYFSEFALIKYRIKVEIEYFIALCQIPLPQLGEFPNDKFEELRKIYLDFSEADAVKIKEIESITNHDVKAVEYYIKEKFDSLGISDYKEYIHFGLTSQDINNTAIPLSLKDGLNDIILTGINEIRSKIKELSSEWMNISMLARTHGQPASPTRLGKELMVFVERISVQLQLIETIPASGKFGGATGNMNAHYVSFPDINWHEFSSSFLRDHLGLKRSFPTTQIEHYDNIAALFDNLKRINVILLDFSRDIWQYISMNYFKQKINENEVGSSAMPHKVNPIDFENAEGNLGIANALLEHLSSKLPVSRLQRDLTDSTVLRNAGVPLAHMLIAYKSLMKGLGKLELNESVIRNDLENHWEVVAEGIQNILRRESYPKPYEKLKELTRKNHRITEKSILEFIDNLDVTEDIKVELRAITPNNYTGK